MDNENFRPDKRAVEAFKLPVKHITIATNEAYARVVNRMDGKQDYIKTRWEKINKAILGGINFSTIYIIAGLMGTGKSYMRMLMQQDAFNTELNGECVHKYLWLHFNFEMEASSEIMRIAGAQLGLSFYELLSIEERLKKEQLEQFKEVLSSFKGKPIFMCDTSGNVHNIMQTARHIHSLPQYADHKMIVSIDHTLLVEKFDEVGENAVMASVASTAIKLKQEIGAAVILISQLKTTLQTPERRSKETNHYPVNDDIFGSKTIPQAADVVILLHRPELLDLETYGPDRHPTKGLLAAHITKNRDGYPGLIRLKHDFSKGIIRQWADEDTLQANF